MNTSKELQTRILHDLKKIAIAINELTRDMDRILRDDNNMDNCDTDISHLGNAGLRTP